MVEKNTNFSKTVPWSQLLTLEAVFSFISLNRIFPLVQHALCYKASILMQ